jgi:prevent-host-death family protein
LALHVLHEVEMRYTIGLGEANHHLAKHIKAVEEGHEVIITRRGRAVARLTPELGDDRTQDPEWQAAYERMEFDRDRARYRR